MKIRYLLKKRGPKGGTYPIYLALYQDDLTEIIFTGQRITLKDWSKKDRAPKDHSSETFQAIEKIKGEVQLAIHRLEAERQPVTPYTVKSQYTATTANKEASQRDSDKKAKSDLVTISKLANQWTETELFRFRPSSQRSVKESINAFTKYLKLAGLATLERKALTPSVISGYERYLLEKKKLSDNTHGKRIKHLRWFLKTLDYDIRNIKIRSGKKAIISLTLAELTKLENVDVSSSVEMQKAKDLFLLGCYTGLRISDLKRLNHTNTQGGHITMTLLKNNRHVQIPIVKECDKILAAYGYRCPKLSEQALNEQIKKVCEKAGIKDRVSIDSTRGGQRISKTFEKHKVITSHIAGKTFITLAPQKWGLTPAEVAAIVGKDLKTLLNSYFNLPGDEARKKIIEMEGRRSMAANS